MIKTKISVIGVGNMASAVIKGISEDGIPNGNVILFDRHPEKTERYGKSGYTVAGSASEAVKNSDIVILAVQPQSFPALLAEIGEGGRGRCFVSIAAGVSIENIEKALGFQAPVIRLMPNAPLLIGKGATAVTRNSGVSERDFRLVCRIFSRMGEIIILPEDRMNEIISVTGSSPAYVYLFIKSIMDSAAAQGIDSDEEQIKKLVCKTVIGSAELMMNSPLSPSELIDKVQTPGGTTEPAVRALLDGGFPNIINEAMLACTKRAYELGNK